MPGTDIDRFLEQCHRLIDASLREAADADVDAGSRLRAVVERHRRKLPDGWSDPLAFTYFVACDAGREACPLLRRYGAACLLYYLALRLFDDIQDHELDGLSYGDSPALAINDATALLSLAMHGFHRVALAEPSLAEPLFALIHRVCMRSYQGQDFDLRGGAGSSAEVLEAARRKSSTTTLLIEGAALICGATPDPCQRWRQVAIHVGEAFQILNDISDVYGKRVSADLAQGRRTYLLARFEEHATLEQLEQLSRLRSQLPGSQADIRALLYHSGALERCLEPLEAARQATHRLVAELPGRGGGRRDLLTFLDQCISGLCSFAPADVSRPLLEPAIAVHQQLRALVRTLVGDVDLRCVPWPHARTCWARGHRTIYYPDAWPDPSSNGAVDVLAQLRRARPDLDEDEARAVATVGTVVSVVRAALESTGTPSSPALALELVERTAPRWLEPLPRALEAIGRVTALGTAAAGTLADPHWWPTGARTDDPAELHHA